MKKRFLRTALRDRLVRGEDVTTDEMKTAIEEMPFHGIAHVIHKFDAAVQMGQKAVRDLLPEKGDVGSGAVSKQRQKARKAKSTSTKRN